MQTKRRYAHELYPHAEECETRPLEVEVPYLYAAAIGHNTLGTDLSELVGSGEPAKLRLSYDRMHILITFRHRALLADALLQGLAGQEAWDWADQRAADESGELVYDRAKHYGVDCDQIKPYPVLAEPDHHDHWSARDARGWRILVETVKCKESECADCCETPEADEAWKAGEQA